MAAASSMEQKQARASELWRRLRDPTVQDRMTLLIMTWRYEGVDLTTRCRNRWHQGTDFAPEQVWGRGLANYNYK